MLTTYRTFNSTVRFSKFKFYNKLLNGVILFKITPGITWIQLLSLIYIWEREREREREREKGVGWGSTCY